MSRTLFTAVKCVLQAISMSEAEKYLEMAEEAFADTAVEGISDHVY